MLEGKMSGNCCSKCGKISQLKTKMPDEAQLYELSDLFKMFGESSRLKILAAIFEKELCVHEITTTVAMTQSAVSHQLRVLKQARLIKSRRDGKMILYSLSDDHVKVIFNMGLLHINE